MSRRGRRVLLQLAGALACAGLVVAVAEWAAGPELDHLLTGLSTSPAPEPPAQPAGPNYTRIEDGLYLGGRVAEPPPGVTAVLNLCEFEDPYKAEAHEWAMIPDAAPAPDLAWLRQRVEWVAARRAEGRTTYVHCFGGISRAGMVTVAYLMWRDGLTRDAALAAVRKERPQVNPNPAFMARLAEWERELAAGK